MLRSIEACGKSGIYGLRYLSQGHLKREYFHEFVKFDMLRREYLNQTFNFLPELEKEYEDNALNLDFEKAQK